MPPCTTEEECRRKKIIADSQVAATAARGIGMAQRGELSLEQLQKLIDLDEEWLQRTATICPDMVAR